MSVLVVERGRLCVHTFEAVQVAAGGHVARFAGDTPAHTATTQATRVCNCEAPAAVCQAPLRSFPA